MRRCKNCFNKLDFGEDGFVCDEGLRNINIEEDFCSKWWGIDILEDPFPRTNFEKYKNELLKGKDAVRKKTGEPAYCSHLDCYECELKEYDKDCVPALIEWGLKEVEGKEND